MRTITILISFALLLGGCRAKKVERTEVKRSDTLILKRETIKAPGLAHTLTISEICDTITGEVVRFEKVFIMNGDSIKVLTDANNALRFEIKARERIISEKDSIISVREEKAVDVSEIVRYKIDWRYTWGALALGLAIGLIKPWRFI